LANPIIRFTIIILTEDDDVEDYEEPGGGNHFLGFMFGNVDDSGDLDADYLDEVMSFKISFSFNRAISGFCCFSPVIFMYLLLACVIC
jgi:hypothetical protein